MSARSPVSLWLMVISGFVLCATGCHKAAPSDTGSPRVEMRIEVIPDDGPRSVRTIAVQDPSRIEASLADAELGEATGRVVIDYTVTLPEEDFSLEQRLEAQLRDGTLDGPAQTFARLDGEWRLMGEYAYELGTQQGPFVMYHPLTGTKAGEGFLNDGQRDGDGVWYYADGTILARTPYAAGAFHGRCEVWDATGTLVVSGIYEHGTMMAGTFIEDLNAYLLASLEGRSLAPRIITVEPTP